MIPGIVQNLFNRPEVTQTATSGTTSGARPHMDDAQERWTTYLDAGATAYGGPIVGAHAPSAAMNQYTGSLGAMQTQYGGQGGIYDQATKRYGELAGLILARCKQVHFYRGLQWPNTWIEWVMILMNKWHWQRNEQPGWVTWQI